MKRLIAVSRALVAGLLIVGSTAPQSLWACACGCNVFDIGTSSMFASHPGGAIWTEYDYQNQTYNWSGSSPDSADTNSDKRISTNLVTLGGEYFVNSRWGFSAELPYTQRYFKTTDDDGNITQFEHSAIGDIRLKGIYTGLSGEMSTGLVFGLKLPTGDYTYPNLDPDTEIGTGSTDLIAGTYQLGSLAKRWNWFAQWQGDFPVIHEAGYVPGSQIDATVGSYYEGWYLGRVKVSPVGQVIGSYRWADAGTYAMNPGSGYSRVLLTPGFEFSSGPIHVYTDVGFPVYQYTSGDQLVAKELYKLNVAYHF